MDWYATIKEIILGAAMMILGILLLLSLIKAIMGPRFTDRIMAVNMISTQGLLMICLISLLNEQQYLVDVALIYALLGFLAVVAMSNILLGRISSEEEKLPETKVQEVEK